MKEKQKKLKIETAKLKISIALLKAENLRRKEQIKKLKHEKQ